LACEKCEYCNRKCRDRAATRVAFFITQDDKGWVGAQRRYLCGRHAEMMERVVGRKGYSVTIRDEI